MLRLGDALQLRTRLLAAPEATVFWLRNGQAITADGTAISITSVRLNKHSFTVMALHFPADL